MEKKEKNKVIHFKSLPTRWPITKTAVVWLLLDRFHPAGWVRGVVWTLVALIWVLAAMGRYHEEYVELADIGK
jgi:hypothetical protein